MIYNWHFQFSAEIVVQWNEGKCFWKLLRGSIFYECLYEIFRLCDYLLDLLIILNVPQDKTSNQ